MSLTVSLLDRTLKLRAADRRGVRITFYDLKPPLRFNPCNDRFFKRHGITNEIQTLDQKFDDDFFIRAEMPDFAREFFQSAERRRAARAIFDLGYNVLELEGGVLQITCFPSRPEKGIAGGLPDRRRLPNSPDSRRTYRSYLPESGRPR
jgi:hypothetical protein